MESFEHLCKVALEAEGFAVSGNIKFPVRRRTKRTSYEESQTHGYEIDLVGARGDELVLAEVKSYLGSVGVNRQGFVGLATRKSAQLDRFKLFNDEGLRKEITKCAGEHFRYAASQVRWRLYVGKFANGHELPIRDHLACLTPPVKVIGLSDVVSGLVELAKKKTYIDDPVIMTVKALVAAGWLSGDAAGIS